MKKYLMVSCFSMTAVLSNSSFAGDILRPADALDETKVGIPAKFIPIKAGTFEMGTSEDLKAMYNNPSFPNLLLDEIPHQVSISKDYEIQATEVTQLQYVLVMEKNPSYFKKKENCDKTEFTANFDRALVKDVELCPDHPVENVSWQDTQKFIGKLNAIQNEYIYRLPTEAQWENAARDGMPRSDFVYSLLRAGNTDKLGDYGWYAKNSGLRTHAVAHTMSSNDIFDMYGNVWEWVQDYYGAYPTTAVIDPVGPDQAQQKVVRGGGWGSNAWAFRPSERGIGMPDYGSSNKGFRLARTKRASETLKLNLKVE